MFVKMGLQINKAIILVALKWMIYASDASLFVVTPENTIVYHGDDTQLNCNFQDTLTNKAWLHGTRRITIGNVIEGPTEHYGLIIDGNEYNLQVYNATSSVSGTYTCESQRRKSITSSADLYVIDDTPGCSVYPNPNVIEGHFAVFTCEIALPYYAPGNVVWYKRGEEYYRGETNEAMWITKLNKSDNGAEFDCQFQHKTLPRWRWSTISCDEKIVMNVQYVPRVSVVTVGNSTILEGSSVIANCSSIDANPREIVEMNWISPDGSLISHHETLVLESMTRHDSGEYTCYMSNVFYNGEKGTGNASVYVNVQYMSNVTLTVNPATNIKEDDSVTFHCRAENGNPNPYWMTLSLGQKYVSYDDGPNLQYTINGVKVSDSGIYKCFILTSFNDGSQKLSFAEQKLTVYYSPKPANVSATHYTATIDDVVRLVCEAYGFPTPTLTWQDTGGGLISHNDKQRQVNEETDGNNVTSTLTVVVADESYYGTYTCKAANGILPNLTQNMEIVGRPIHTSIVFVLLVSSLIAVMVMLTAAIGIKLYCFTGRREVKKSLGRYRQETSSQKTDGTHDPIRHRKGKAKLSKPLITNEGRGNSGKRDDRFDPGSTDQRKSETRKDVASELEPDTSRKKT